MSKAALKKIAPAQAPEILPAVVSRAEAGQVAATKAQEAVVALAKQLNYNGSTDPGVLENSARDAIRRIGAGIFELGGYLLLLRQASEHGAFLPALERLGLEPRAAQQYMSVAKRFANAKSISHLEGAGIAKLVELVALDNEQLEELTELGQTGELALDDVARMSVKDLRAKVRELRGEREADAQLLEKKNAKIDKLEREKKLIQRLPPDKSLLKLREEATAIMNDALGCLRGGLREALAALQVSAGEETRESDVFMAGLVGQIAAECAALREEFDLPDVSNAAGADDIDLDDLAALTARNAKG